MFHIYKSYLIFVFQNVIKMREYPVGRGENAQPQDGANAHDDTAHQDPQHGANSDVGANYPPPSFSLLNELAEPNMSHGDNRTNASSEANRTNLFDQEDRTQVNSDIRTKASEGVIPTSLSDGAIRTNDEDPASGASSGITR